MGDGSEAGGEGGALPPGQVLAQACSVSCRGGSGGSSPHSTPRHTAHPPGSHPLNITGLLPRKLPRSCCASSRPRASSPRAVIPSLNIAAGLLGFFLLKSLAKGLDWAKLPVRLNPPLTAQEVTVIQVRALSCVLTSADPLESRRHGLLSRQRHSHRMRLQDGWHAAMCCRRMCSTVVVLWRQISPAAAACFCRMRLLSELRCLVALKSGVAVAPPADDVRGVLRTGLQRRVRHLRDCHGLPVLLERGRCGGQPAAGEGLGGICAVVLGGKTRTFSFSF